MSVDCSSNKTENGTHKEDQIIHDPRDLCSFADVEIESPSALSPKKRRTSFREIYSFEARTPEALVPISSNTGGIKKMKELLREIGYI